MKRNVIIYIYVFILYKTIYYAWNTVIFECFNVIVVSSLLVNPDHFNDQKQNNVVVQLVHCTSMSGILYTWRKSIKLGNSIQHTSLPFLTLLGLVPKYTLILKCSAWFCQFFCFPFGNKKWLSIYSVKNKFGFKFLRLLKAYDHKNFFTNLHM